MTGLVNGLHKTKTAESTLLVCQSHFLSLTLVKLWWFGSGIPYFSNEMNRNLKSGFLCFSELCLIHTRQSKVYHLYHVSYICTCVSLDFSLCTVFNCWMPLFSL